MRDGQNGRVVEEGFRRRGPSMNDTAELGDEHLKVDGAVKLLLLRLPRTPWKEPVGRPVFRIRGLL